ncbi:hemerythrin domain-containing protein [Kineococcus sp. SYSU DK002]|uniref:hemerythrin domain-containing protein n=1 Tax=Kineococcus sp. SYSU DK002 TaxID=3383123 RepID=UPI003D7E3E53
MTNPRGNGLRSVADQSEQERGGPGSILSRQSRDHAELDELMRSYDRATGPAERGRVVAEVGERALRHAFAEETVLFPAYRRFLAGDDDELTRHIEGDHQTVNEALERLQGADPADAGYDEVVRHAFEVIRHDAHDEEDDLLPRLQQAVGVEELRSIGAAWEVQRRLSPTRPHPRVPREPPGNVLAGIPLAVSDRVKDAFDAGGARRGVAVAVVAVAAAGALVVLARAVRRAGRGGAGPRA